MSRNVVLLRGMIEVNESHASSLAGIPNSTDLQPIFSFQPIFWIS